MRAATQRKIDDCHAEIDRLVETERAWLQRVAPLKDPRGLLAGIRDAQLRCAAWSPLQRAEARVATASFPA